MEWLLYFHQYGEAMVARATSGSVEVGSNGVDQIKTRPDSAQVRTVIAIKRFKVS
jgi:hypothetical protein